jgi:hypothetical protein
VLNRPRVPGSQRLVHIMQRSRVFVQKERGDLLEEVEISAESSQRSCAIKNLFLQLCPHCRSLSS